MESKKHLSESFRNWTWFIRVFSVSIVELILKKRNPVSAE